MKKPESKIKAGSLFKSFESKPVKEPEIISKPQITESKVAASAAQSQINGWTSIYDPDKPIDRFVLISSTGVTFSCKFYNKETDSFIGASLISIYELNEYFDRSIIPEQETSV